MVIKEAIESIQKSRIEKSLIKATGSNRQKLLRSLQIIKENRARRTAVSKARAQAKFKSQLQQAREQPAFDEAQRQATQKFKLKTLQSKGRLPQQQRKGALAGLDKFLAGTGVAQGTAPILRGDGRATGKLDILGGGGKRKKGDFRII